MEVLSNIKNNSTNFRGIRLSSNDFDKVREVVMHLKRTGFDCIGKKEIFVSNTFNEKHSIFEKLREKTPFGDLQFGAVFLPWSKEAYLIAQPRYEQLMLPVIKHVDNGAKINFLF